MLHLGNCFPTLTSESVEVCLLTEKQEKTKLVTNQI